MILCRRRTRIRVKALLRALSRSLISLRSHCGEEGIIQWLQKRQSGRKHSNSSEDDAERRAQEREGPRIALVLISHEVPIPIDEGDDGEGVGDKMTAQPPASHEVQRMVDEKMYEETTLVTGNDARRTVEEV